MEMPEADRPPEPTPEGKRTCDRWSRSWDSHPPAHMETKREQHLGVSQTRVFSLGLFRTKHVGGWGSPFL